MERVAASVLVVLTAFNMHMYGRGLDVNVCGRVALE